MPFIQAKAPDVIFKELHRLSKELKCSKSSIIIEALESHIRYLSHSKEVHEALNAANAADAASEQKLKP